MGTVITVLLFIIINITINIIIIIGHVWEDMINEAVMGLRLMNILCK